MIVTLTANPSLDRTIALAAPLEPGRVQVAASAREDAGGKGINVSRVLAAAGVDTLAVLPLADDDPYRTALAAARIAVRAVPVDGACRANVTVTDPAGVTTKLNLPGATPSAAELSALSAVVVAAARAADWLVLAGSLPPGVPDDFYASVIHAVRAQWGDASPRIAVDASGAALHAVVAGSRPDLITPNDDELAELTGTHPDAAADPLTRAADLARGLTGTRAGEVLVTLGARGAVLVGPGGAWRGDALPIRPRSTVGAGDSALAGFLTARVAGRGPADCLAAALRYGAAAASLPGTEAPRPADLPAGDIAVTPVTC